MLQGVKSLFKQLRKDFKIARGTTEEATFRVVFEKVFYDCAKNARKAAASRGVQVAPGKGCAGAPAWMVWWPRRTAIASRRRTDASTCAVITCWLWLLVVVCGGCLGTHRWVRYGAIQVISCGVFNNVCTCTAVCVGCRRMAHCM